MTDVRLTNKPFGAIPEYFAGLENLAGQRNVRLFSRENVANTIVSSLGSLGSYAFATKADLDSDLAYPANTVAAVYVDGSPANNGIYRKIGGSGVGAWTRVADLPYSFIKLANVGAGTANAIVATSAVSLPSASYAAIFTMPITANNTGAVTVAVNGGTPKPLKTNSGAAIASGYLVADMLAAFVDDGTNFRLLTDVASAAIQAAAEVAAAASAAARDVAETARDAAIAAADVAIGATGYADFPTRTAAVAATIPVEKTFIRTAGFFAAGDWGAALYVRTGGSTPGGFQSADGGWWKLAERAMRPEFFAEISETVDSTAAWQAAIDTAGVFGLVKGAPRKYKIDGSIYIPGGIHLRGEHTMLYTENQLNAMWNVETTVSDLYYLDIDGFELQANVAGHGVTTFPRAFNISGPNRLLRVRLSRLHIMGFWNAISVTCPFSWALIDGCLIDNYGLNGHDLGISIDHVGVPVGEQSGQIIISNNRIMVGYAGSRGVYMHGNIGDTIIAVNQIEGGLCGLDLDATTYGGRFQVGFNKMDTSPKPIRITNISGSSFIGNGFAGDANIETNGDCTYNTYNNARAGSGSVTRTFAGTLTGCTTAPTGTLRWDRQGNVVQLELPDISATSNSSSMTITGLPSEITPARNQNCPVRIQDNGAYVAAGLVTVGADGVIRCYTNPAAAGFTTSGTKGVGATTISYLVE